ncbi:MAG: GLUG motif-containing protein [Phycisphaerales bacterium]
MERSRSFCCEVAVVVLALALGAQAQYSGGSGAAQDPYRIATAADLIALGQTVKDYDKHFVLTADIDLAPGLPGRKAFDKAVIGQLYGVSGSAVPWDPIFTGVFDGNDHTIRNLTITQGSYAGLFGGLGSSGRIIDLRLDAVNVKSTGVYVGGLVGYSMGSVVHCRVSGTVSGGDYVGGLVGYIRFGHDVISCHSAAVVAGNNQVGGIAGGNEGCVACCLSSGAVNGNLYVGGLVGSSSDSVINCCNTAAVHGNRFVGGLMSRNGLRMVNCYSTGPVTANADVGGLVGCGEADGIISSFWDVQTSGFPNGIRGKGRTTAQLQDRATFLNAGWDLAGESLHGTADTWQMSPGQYPTLRSLAEEKPPMPEGAGTVEDPYRIYDACDLGTVWLDPDAHYRLEDSLDLAGIAWSTAVIPWLGGSFDGNGRVIKNLHIQGDHLLGLVGKLASGGSILRLGLEDVDVNGLSSHIGSFAGSNTGDIADVYSTGVIHGQDYTGGLVGTNGGSIADSYTAASVVGARYAGGIAAFNGGSITHCSNRGTIVGDGCTGGIAGGNDEGSLDECCSTGAVTGEDYVGGLVGLNSGGVANSYNAGKINGKNDVGGGVGYNYTSVLNCYSNGKVVGIDKVGGLVGLNSGSITNSYSSGRVDGNWTVGGMLASNKGQVLGCFWDTRSSGWETSAGGTGKTTAEMQAAATFLGAGWDFIGEKTNGTKEIWWILEGKDYPRLGWELDEK